MFSGRVRTKFSYNYERQLIFGLLAVVLVQCVFPLCYFASFAFNTLKKLPPRILVISFLLYPFSTNAFVING